MLIYSMVTETRQASLWVLGDCEFANKESTNNENQLFWLTNVLFQSFGLIKSFLKRLSIII